MTTDPVPRGERVVLRPAQADDVAALVGILRRPEVARWWGRWDLARGRREFLGGGGERCFVVLVDDAVAGLVQYLEEEEPDYRHAAIDIFLHPNWRGRGLGADAVRTLARHLITDRDHHRVTIDPAAENERAIASYRRVGDRRRLSSAVVDRRGEGMRRGRGRYADLGAGLADASLIALAARRSPLASRRSPSRRSTSVTSGRSDRFVVPQRFSSFPPTAIGQRRPTLTAPATLTTGSSAPRHSPTAPPNRRVAS